MKKKETILEMIQKHLDTLTQTCFYGRVELKYRAGKIVDIQVIHNIKPEELQ